MWGGVGRGGGRWAHTLPLAASCIFQSGLGVMRSHVCLLSELMNKWVEQKFRPGSTIFLFCDQNGIDLPCQADEQRITSVTVFRAQEALCWSL